MNEEATDREGQDEEKYENEGKVSAMRNGPEPV